MNKDKKPGNEGTKGYVPSPPPPTPVKPSSAPSVAKPQPANPKQNATK